MTKFSIIYFIFTLFVAFEGKSAAGQHSVMKDDGLAFDRVLRNFVGKSTCVASLAAASASSSIPDMKRLLVLDTVEQLEYVARKLSGVSFDVLVLGGFHEKSHEVAKICDVVGSKIRMLGRDRYESYVDQQEKLGASRAKEVKFGFSISDITAVNHYDIVFMAGEMNNIMPAAWYHGRILHSLKMGAHAYFMDVLKADWDISCHGWKERIIGSSGGAPVYGMPTHGFHHFKGKAVKRPDKDRLTALARTEASVDIAMSELPTEFRPMKYIDVFRKLKLVMPEAAASSES